MFSHFLFYFSLVFDFKGIEEGGNIIQLIFFLFTISTAAHIIFKEKTYGIEGRSHRLVGSLLITHLVLTLLVVLILDVEFFRYLRVVLPYFFLVLGYFVGVRTFAKVGLDKTIYLLTLALIVATVFTFFYGLVNGDFSSSGIRYQVLSPALFILVPVLAHKIFILKKGVKVTTFLMTIIVFLILISATRTFLIAYVGVLILAMSILQASSFLGVVKGGLRGLFVVSILATIFFPILEILLPEIISRFSERIFIYREFGFDITSVARIVEMDNQIEAWSSDISTFLIGKGLGASYGFSGESLYELANLLGTEITYATFWTAGHNFWVYSLFSQGVLLGCVLPLVILGVMFYTLKGILVKRTMREVNKKNRFDLILFFLVFSSVILSTIGTNPLAYRMFSQYLGVFLSLSLISLHHTSLGNTNYNSVKSIARKLSGNYSQKRKDKDAL